MKGGIRGSGINLSDMIHMEMSLNFHEYGYTHACHEHLLQEIISMNVGKYSRVNSDNRKYDAEKRHSCEFVDKLYTNVYNAAFMLKRVHFS